MASTLNAGDVNRGNLFFVPPSEIQVDESSNGRWLPHDEESIVELVKSYEQVGQLQPVQIRKIADNKVSLVMGYRRWKAALRFNELHPDKPMKLKCVLVQVNAEETLIRNIAENRERKETTPVDDAHNQRRLREDHGWTDTKIAEFYKVTSPYVSQLKKVLSLSRNLQLKIHGKELSLQAALALADLPEEDRHDVESTLKPTVSTTEDPSPATVSTEPSNNSNGKVSTQEILKKIRKKKIKNGSKQARSLSEVKTYFEELTGPAEHAKIRSLAELMLWFTTGSITDEDMTRELNKLLVS